MCSLAKIFIFCFSTRPWALIREFIRNRKEKKYLEGIKRYEITFSSDDLIHNNFQNAYVENLIAGGISSRGHIAFSHWRLAETPEQNKRANFSSK